MGRLYGTYERSFILEEEWDIMCLCGGGEEGLWGARGEGKGADVC